MHTTKKTTELEKNLVASLPNEKINTTEKQKAKQIQKDFDQQFGKEKVKVISGENSRTVKFLIRDFLF
ncbi:MAG: hypothetical protein JJV94_08490 [Sulfurospirillum sp.]|nr:hypothetical protein [Sulfurospirillum sp.]